METDYPPKPQNAPADAPGEVQAASVQAGHEVTDVSVAGLTAFFVGLVGVVAVVFVGIALFFRVFGAVDEHLDKNVRRREPGAATQIHTRPDYTGPELQVVPEKDLGTMRGVNKRLLDTYGWVDRPTGVVRVPIDQAMKLLATRGIPPVGGGQTLESIQQQRAQPQVYGQVLRP